MSRLVRLQGVEYDAAHGCVEATRQLIALLNDPDPEDPEDPEDGNAIDEALRLLCLECDRTAADAAFATRPRTADAAACFKLLRDAGASLDAVDRDRWTPLHHAAIRANVEILTLLVEAGANVNAADSDGCTALHFAPSTRALACVEVLLAAGASVNARNVSGRTPFDAALSNDKRRWWPLFLRAGAQIPRYPSHPYILHVRNAGGFKKYEQAHLARITAILAQTPRLPPEMVRKIVEFWLHAGYY